MKQITTLLNTGRITTASLLVFALTSVGALAGGTFSIARSFHAG
jgi:hypothetical protein